LSACRSAAIVVVDESGSTTTTISVISGRLAARDKRPPGGNSPARPVSVARSWCFDGAGE
jgi:hypothetical protein